MAQSRQPTSASPRRDPAHRHVDGSSPWNRIRNKPANMRLCWVSKACFDDYCAIGYDVIRSSKGGPEPLGARVTQKEGEPIEMQGNLLMGMPQERWEEIERYGVYGDTGQEEVDQIEKLIIKRDAAQDLLRGIPGLRGRKSGDSVLEIQNQTEALSPVYG